MNYVKGHFQSFDCYCLRGEAYISHFQVTKCNAQFERVRVRFAWDPDIRFFAIK